jgi:hypothetical protein
MTIKYYTKQLAGILPDIFENKTHFLRAFGGNLQVKTGAEADGNFLTLKTSDTDVVVQAYDTGANVGMGSGTGSTSRFGARNEIKSVDTTVPYEAPLAIHEGIDGFTVNDAPDTVIAERLALHSVAWATEVDTLLSNALAANANATAITGTMNAAGITKAFNDAHANFVNKKVSRSVAWVAYVNTEVYNILVDNNLTTTSKNSRTNIDTQTVEMFKGFEIVEVPDTEFAFEYIDSADVALVDGKEYYTKSGSVYTKVATPDVGNIATYYEKQYHDAYFAADNVGVAGVGVKVARSMDSEDFAGIALQAAAEYGKHIPTKNSDAIYTAVFSAPAA